MSVDPGKEQEYERRHRPIWQELEATLIRHGVRTYSIFLDPDHERSLRLRRDRERRAMGRDRLDRRVPALVGLHARRDARQPRQQPRKPRFAGSVPFARGPWRTILSSHPSRWRGRSAAPRDSRSPRSSAQSVADRRSRRRRSGRRHLVGGIHPVAVHRLAGRPRLPVGRGARHRHAVLHQHGDRALHARDRRDGADRVQPIVAALGPGVRRHGVFRQPVARLGAELGDADHVSVRRRRAAVHRDRAPARDRRVADARARGLRRAGAADLRQGRRRGDLRPPRAGLRGEGGQLARAAGRVVRRGRDAARARVRAALRRDRVCRRRRRAESLSEQLDPRQGVRHGRLRAAAGEPADRRRGSGRDRRLRLHLRDDARQHGAVAPLVVVRQHRAAPDVHARQHRDHLPDLDDRPLHALRHARPAEQRRISADRRAAAAVDRRHLVRRVLLGRRARSRCSRPRWGSPTTPAGWPPTC